MVEARSWTERVLGWVGIEHAARGISGVLGERLPLKTAKKLKRGRNGRNHDRGARTNSQRITTGQKKEIAVCLYIWQRLPRKAGT